MVAKSDLSETKQLLLSRKQVAQVLGNVSVSTVKRLEEMGRLRRAFNQSTRRGFLPPCGCHCLRSGGKVMVKPLSPLTHDSLLAKAIPFKENSPRTAELLALSTGARLHLTGLQIPADLELDKWAVIGEELAQIGNGVQWALGDWWAYGHHKYGERKAAAAAKKFLTRLEP
jgi:hypothetical protein